MCDSQTRTMNRIDIEAILPHRGPMLLISYVSIDSSGIYAGFFKPKANAWYLKGHFPGDPIIPASILLEAAAQFGLIVSAEKLFFGQAVEILAKELTIKMKSGVRPGDVVKIVICDESKVRKVKNSYLVTGKTRLTVNGKTVADTFVSGLLSLRH